MADLQNEKLKSWSLFSLPFSRDIQNYVFVSNIVLYQTNMTGLWKLIFRITQNKLKDHSECLKKKINTDISTSVVYGLLYLEC